MTATGWTYPKELLDAVSGFGLAPRRETPPRLVRDQVSDLYRFEIRRLRERLLAGNVAKADYIGQVIQLRKKYWPLTLMPEAWDRICQDPGTEV